jgi:branched-chain amino acid transport system substrate-binding protein
VTAANFAKLGGTVASQEAVAPTDVDMHPLLSAIASKKPDVLYAPVFVAAAAQLLRQSKETPGLDHIPMIGGGSLAAPDFVEAAEPSVVGFRICYPDVSTETMGNGYPKFLEDYKKAYGEAPTSGYHADSYDTGMMAIKAIEKVGKADQSGNLFIGKKALRDAVYASRFDGLSGPIACDPYGQCASFKPAVMEFTSADPKPSPWARTRRKCGPSSRCGAWPGIEHRPHGRYLRRSPVRSVGEGTWATERC